MASAKGVTGEKYLCVVGENIALTGETSIIAKVTTPAKRIAMHANNFNAGETCLRKCGINQLTDINTSATNASLL